jgi:hypothetical protein
MPRLTRRVKELEKQVKPQTGTCAVCYGTGKLILPIDVPSLSATYEEWQACRQMGREHQQKVKTAAAWCGEIAEGHPEVASLLLDRLSPNEEVQKGQKRAGCFHCGGTGYSDIEAPPKREESYGEWLIRKSREDGQITCEEWCNLIAHGDDVLEGTLLQRPAASISSPCGNVSGRPRLRIPGRADDDGGSSIRLSPPYPRHPQTSHSRSGHG